MVRNCLPAVREFFPHTVFLSCLEEVKGNMQSAKAGCELNNAYWAAECAEGRVLGPFEEQSLPQFQVSHLGVVPKHILGQ